MSDEHKVLISTNVPWDDESQMVDREPASDGGKHHFGLLRLYPLQVAKSYTAGDYVTIDGVQGGDFNKKDENGNMKFKGWRPNGDRWLFVFVATKTSQDGSPYQIVKQYKHKPDKSEDGHPWGDIVYPAYKQLPQAQRDKMIGEGVPAEWEDVDTGQVFETDAGEKKPIYAWGNFKVFSSADEMKAAEKEFFSQFSVNGATAEASSIYPTSWSSDINGMIEYVKQLHTEGKPLADIAKEAMLADARTDDGQPVNVKKVLSSILDVPEPMIELPF